MGSVRGLVAVISHDRERPVAETEMTGLAGAFESLRGVSVQESVAAGHFARVVRFAADGASHIESDGASWVASHGLVLHDGSLIGAEAEDLDGQFSLVSFNARTGEVVVAVDRYGLQALYVAERLGKTYVSTSALALARYLRAEPDLFGLQFFLRKGNHHGEVTHFRGIERLKPGVQIRFQDRSVTRETYFRPQFDHKVAEMGLAEAAEHLVDVAVETFAKQLDPDVEYCANITGGYDSRLVNLLLREAGIRFRTNTRGAADHPDVQIAREIARLTGWDWLHIEHPPEWPDMAPNLLDQALAWGDGHLDVFDLSAALWQPPEMGIEPIMFNGGGPEAMRSYHWWHELANIGRSNRVDFDRMFNMRTMAKKDMSVLAEDPSEAIRANILRRLSAWVEPHAGRVNTWQLDMIGAYMDTSHFGLYGPAFGAYGLIQSPFYYGPINQKAASVHWKHRLGHGLMRHAINHLDPKVAALPTTMGGPAEPIQLSNLHRFVPYGRSVGRRATNKISKRAIGRQLINHSKPGPTETEKAARRNCLEVLRVGGRSGVTRYLPRSASLYDEAVVTDLLHRAEQTDFEGHELLGRILTVEMVLRATDTSLDAD